MPSIMKLAFLNDHQACSEALFRGRVDEQWGRDAVGHLPLPVVAVKWRGKNNAIDTEFLEQAFGSR